jgi:hypothetical protein
MNSYTSPYALGTPPPCLEDLHQDRPRRKRKSTSRKSRTRTTKVRWARLLESARRIGEESRPIGVRFVRTIVQLVESGKVALLPRESGNIGGDSTCDKEVVGWIDNQALYLLPDASLGAVRRHWQEKGEDWDVDQAQLRSDLMRLGALITNKGRRTASVRVGKKVVKVLRLPRSAVERLLRV